MATQFNELRPGLIDFIKEQKIFFTGTAADTGRVNVSPKGMDSLRVLDSKTVAWLNLTGSGNESAAHILKNNRMTIMFCAFQDPPLILRLYGTVSNYHAADPEFEKYISLFPKVAGARQIMLLHIEMVQTSCGYGVPYMTYTQDRTRLKEWGEAKSQEEIEAYWIKKNSQSIDGFDTQINTKL